MSWAEAAREAALAAETPREGEFGTSAQAWRPRPVPASAPVPHGPEDEPAPSTSHELDPPTPVWLLPALWFNQVFDLGLDLWGPLGRWLQRGPGRNLLGFLGLGCLGLAVLWVLVDLCGWIW
jgi:hypothetical protein